MNDLSEKEQLDEMRAWWAEYGRFVITGLVLGGSIIFGWNQWQSSISATRIEASVLFEQVMDAVQAGDVAAAETAANNLFAEYGRTVYPGQSRLAMARLYMDKGRDQDAADVLRELVGADDASEIQLVARLRLAKILLYQNKSADVVELLRDRAGGGFSARYSELLGDAYAVQGDFAEAEMAYTAALGEDPSLRTVDPNLVQLKLNDLPDPAELAATSVAIEAAAEGDEISGASEEPIESTGESAGESAGESSGEITADDEAEADSETGQ